MFRGDLIKTSPNLLGETTWQSWIQEGPIFYKSMYFKYFPPKLSNLLLFIIIIENNEKKLGHTLKLY